MLDNLTPQQVEKAKATTLVCKAFAQASSGSIDTMPASMVLLVSGVLLLRLRRRA